MTYNIDFTISTPTPPHPVNTILTLTDGTTVEIEGEELTQTLISNTYKDTLKSCVVGNSVYSIENYAFSGCSSLTSLKIPDSVDNIGQFAFQACSSLASINIPSSVTRIENYTFNGCSCLTSVIIPDSIKNIGNYAFSGCTGLTSIVIPNSVTSIGTYAFENVLNIVYNGTAAGAPWGAKNINKYVDGYLVYDDARKTLLLGCSTAAIGEIVIPNSVTSIGKSACESCSSLTSITIPNSVISIGEKAFLGCKGLTSIEIPNSVTSIGTGAFGSISAKILFSKLYSTYNYKILSTPSTSGSITYNVEFNISEIPSGYNISTILPQIADSGKPTLTYNIYTDYAPCKDQAIALVTQKTIVNVYHIDGTPWE